MRRLGRRSDVAKPRSGVPAVGAPPYRPREGFIWVRLASSARRLLQDVRRRLAGIYLDTSDTRAISYERLNAERNALK